MIKSIFIDNFKSLVDFKLELAKFTCLVGLNGAGKSTVLQAMDFLSQLMAGDLDDWLAERQWDSADINSKLTTKSNISFEVVVESASFGEMVWSGSINRKTLSCTKERVEVAGNVVLRVDDAYCSLAKVEGAPKDSERFPVMFEYQGSILSQLKESQINPLLQALKESIIGIRSLDLLSPEKLRSRNKSAGGKLGLGGQKLSAFIHESSWDVKNQLKAELSTVYPQLQSIDTKSLRSGWKQLEIVEAFGKQKLKTGARHMNDGMLRMMAVLAQLEAGNEFLLFDEIENGINPELIEFLIDRLVGAEHQILVTTHSPMILNFMEDKIAKEGVVYLYKTKEGYTKSIRLFDIPSMAKKLDFMGPGEVFIDTDLTNISQEIITLQ